MEYQTALLPPVKLYAGQEATEPDMEQWIGSQLGKEYVKAICCHPGIKMAGRNINNFRYATDTTVKAEREEVLKSLLMKVKEGSAKERKGKLLSRVRLFMTPWIVAY